MARIHRARSVLCKRRGILLLALLGFAQLTQDELASYAVGAPQPASARTQGARWMDTGDFMQRVRQIDPGARARGRGGVLTLEARGQTIELDGPAQSISLGGQTQSA